MIVEFLTNTNEGKDVIEQLEERKIKYKIISFGRSGFCGCNAPFYKFTIDIDKGDFREVEKISNWQREKELGVGICNYGDIREALKKE